MQLNEYQNQFKNLMLDHPDALETPPEDIAAFCATGDIPLPARLKVYRNNIVGSLTDLLKLTFPTVLALVGDKFFETMARSFILKHPPSKGVLSHYGEGMDTFIADYAPAKTLPYLSDIAAYEIAKNHSYHAADDQALSTEMLANVNPDELDSLPVQLRANVHLVASRFPLTDIEKFCREDAPESTLDVDQGGQKLMVFRNGFDIDVISVGDAEFAFLDHLQKGKTLGDATTLTLEHHTNFDIQAILAKHLSLETFAAL